MKEFIRSAGSRVVVSSGISSAGRRIFPKLGSIILYGHRVKDDAEGYLTGLCPLWFAEQIEYITRHYEVISLVDLAKCFEKCQIPPKNSVVLTFDDGFRDNFDHAFPILQKYKIPATIFLVTGCLSTGDLPWSQQLGYVFQQTAKRSFQHHVVDGEYYAMTTSAERERAYAAVKGRMRQMGRAQRDSLLLEIRNELNVETPRDRMLTWDQACEMQSAGIDFGAHTFSHPLLANIDPREAKWEMERSMEDLRDRLGLSWPSFCFPSGSYSSALVDMVKSLGFRSVFQSRPGLRVNSPAVNDQFTLSRVGLPNAPSHFLEAELDGPFHLVRNLYRR